MSAALQAAVAAALGTTVGLAVWWLASRLTAAGDRQRLRQRLRPVRAARMASAGGAPAAPTVPRQGLDMTGWRAACARWIVQTLDRLRGLERLSRDTPAVEAAGRPAAAGTAGPTSAAPARTRPGEEAPSLELRLARAGFTQAQAAQRLLVLKSVLFLLLPALTASVLLLLAPPSGLQAVAIALTLSAAAAHYGPDAALAWLAARRRERLERQLPGFTDLLQVCVQSGMGLDAAVQRVVADYRHSAPELSQAFHQAALEMRAGVARQAALQRLALIGHTADLRTLVSMLVQAEQFGTSLADALKQQAEEIRARRMARAEERAARIPVLMLIPLVLCIFPALMAVLMGPAVIQVMQSGL